MTEAACLTACLAGGRFGLATFGATETYRERIAQHGLAARLAGLVGVDATPQEAVRDPDGVAAKMLAKRANDGRFVPFSFTAGTGAGEWRPELPMFASDPFAWVSNVKPFAIGRASRFRTAGPLSLTSAK